MTPVNRAEVPLCQDNLIDGCSVVGIRLRSIQTLATKMPNLLRVAVNTRPLAAGLRRVALPASLRVITHHNSKNNSVTAQQPHLCFNQASQ